jgi:hypothetical protein
MSLVAVPSAEAASAPTVALGPTTLRPAGRLYLSGAVNPDGSTVTACSFEYGPEAGVYDHQAPCANHPGDEVQSLRVAATSGTFHLSFESETTSDLPFDATPAEVEAALRALTAIGPEGVGVSLEGAVIGYRRYRIAFQGPLADLDVPLIVAANGAVPLAGGISPEARVEGTAMPGGLSAPAQVTAALEGLSAGATYHYRLVAENALGPSATPDETFLAASEPSAEPCPNAGAPGSVLLSDCRAWEMVSPPDKNGGDVAPDQSRVRVADDGSAATFESLAGLGDVQGMGVAADYLAVRSGAPGTQGWATHGIDPAQPAISYQGILEGFEVRYEQELSPDLSSGVVFAWRPLTEEPTVANVANLYLRRDLLSPGPGSYQLVTRCPLCSSPLPTSSLPATPKMLAATPDLGKVLFESTLNLAVPASGGKPKLYQWDEQSGAVSLVGILPNGAAAFDSAAGTGHGLYTHQRAISEDGRRVFFIADQPAGATNVYMRLDGTATIKLNKSEAGAETTEPAHYVAASASGSRVFFTSNALLTEDAPVTGCDKLYMYDTTKPDSDPHNLTFINVDGEPADPASNCVPEVVGASADGSTVYFVDSSQLVAGMPGRPPGIPAAMYAWHEGEISFVAYLPTQDEEDLEDGTRKKARVTPAGDLLYLSSEPVGPAGYPHGYCPNNVSLACQQVYVYDLSTHSLSCASCRPDGAPGKFNAETLVVEGAGGSAITGHLSRIASADGRYVFFTTAEALLPEDTNGVKDAYEFDARTGIVNLLSSGHSSSDSYFMETTPSGNDAYFVTREQLVGWDKDQSYDLYDARLGGGFPEPLPLSAPCEGEESCRGQSPPLPSIPPVGSTQSGPGNEVVRRPRPCPKGRHRIRRHGRRRCVKTARHHKRGVK